MAVDFLNQPVDPKILNSLFGELIQAQFRNQLQQADPLRQTQIAAQQFELGQAQQKQAAMEAARARLQGQGAPQSSQPGLGGDLTGGGPESPITFGRNPRTGVATFNNLGWMGDTSALPENQRVVAERLNQEAVLPAKGEPIKPEAMKSIHQMAIDLQLAGVPGSIQDMILERMFPTKGKMTDREKIELQAELTARNQEDASKRTFVRDMVKTSSQGVDPKKFQLAQEAVAQAILSGQDPNKVAESFGFNFMADTASPVRGMLSWLPGVDETTPGNMVLEPSGSPMQQMLRQSENLPQAIQQLMGVMPQRAPRAQAPQPAAQPQAQAERVVVTKDGKDFSLPASQLKEAEKQGYKLKK